MFDTCEMAKNQELDRVHPTGEGVAAGMAGAEGSIGLDTYAGKVQVQWEPDGAVSALGQMIFFIQFLKTAGVFESWVEESPLRYTSPNAPSKIDVLGTILLSIVAGHKRYAHVSAIRSDGVNPELLGMKKVVSEDSVRRAFHTAEEKAGDEWMSKHLRASYELLLEEPWILDIDSTVKPLYGHQEEAKKGYNPGKPGRPSHVYHTYFIGNLRIVLDAEVQAGNQTASSYAQPGLWKFVDGLGAQSRPAFLRGDCGWGTEGMMREAEQRKLGYLFKLKQSGNVKKLLGRLFGTEGWSDAGQGWQGMESELQLQGWSQTRRVVVLRRPIREPAELAGKKKKKATDKNAQLSLDLGEMTHAGVLYEYAVLVTSLPDEVLTIAQHYRDRADSENNFDELKNQWGWSGYTTQDMKRCQIMARIIALIYNWWTLYARLVNPDKHAEAITSRPLLLHAIAKQTRHGNQTTVTITSTHAKAGIIQVALGEVGRFLKWVKSSTEQLSRTERWRLILSHAFRKFLHGSVLGSTPKLAPATV
jgi:hypothetical protein